MTVKTSIHFSNQLKVGLYKIIENMIYIYVRWSQVPIL